MQKIFEKQLHWTILLGQCEKILKEMPDNCIDSIITDPPAAIDIYGKNWDSDKGGKEQWCNWLRDIMTECLRVLKPGAHAFVWAYPRKSHWTMNAIEDAGFEIKDIVHALFGTGYPSGSDVSKSIDKRFGAERKEIGPDPRIVGDYIPILTEPATEEAKKWDGWKTRLKPAVEHWILCQKPVEKSIIDNVLKWEIGALNVKDCEYNDKYPPNAVLNDVDLGKATNYFPNFIYCPKPSRYEKNFGLDGMTKKIKGAEDYSRGGNTLKGSSNRIRKNKATRSENNHPCVKAINLLRWLCRLITPPEGIVLDPFSGSGSTGIAALKEHCRFIGIESDPEYVEISKMRIVANTDSNSAADDTEQ